MISVDKLNEKICGDYDAIIAILSELGLPNIHLNKAKHEIRCSRQEGRNPTSIRFNTDTLSFKCFSTDENGNLYTMVMEQLNKTFPQALRWISDVLNIDESNLKSETIKLPFGGYFKKIKQQMDEPELTMKHYDEELLRNYDNNYSLLFCRDGIGYDTQRFFRIGYDFNSNRITIPQWDVNGNLVGVMGRLNQIEQSDYRWHPVIPCQRSFTLYGYHYNYQEIQKKQYCFIGESEKFVMQMRSMGARNTLATCGCDISMTQARYIKSLMCKRYILCFDEGLSEEFVRRQAQKIKMENSMFKNKVGYTYDANGEILRKGTKNAPSDLGVQQFKKLIKEKIIWI